MIAGGHCAFNPEPLADFVDAFALGDGEEIVGEINDAMAAWLARPTGERDRQELRLALAGIEGVYVPALYTSTYRDGRLVSTRPEPARRAGRSGQADGDATWPTGPTRPARWCR